MRVQNKHLPYASFIFMIKHPPHDYFLIRYTLNMPTLSSRCLDADFNLISSILNSSIDAPDLLYLLYFRIPSHNTRNRQLFVVLIYKTS